MALVIDIEPAPSCRCFFTYMRELKDFLDTSSPNQDREFGHPFFKTEDEEEYQTLIKTSAKNKGIARCLL